MPHVKPAEAPPPAAAETPPAKIPESTDDVVAQIRDMATRIPRASPVQSITEVTAPFSQREHDLMLDSVDHIASNWVEQLREDRATSEELEQLVVERIAKIKADLTQLFLLGGAVVSKVKRDGEFKDKLRAEIDKLAEEPVT